MVFYKVLKFLQHSFMLDERDGFLLYSPRSSSSWKEEEDTEL